MNVKQGDISTIRINTNNTIIQRQKNRKLTNVLYQGTFGAVGIGLPELTINDRLIGYKSIDIISNGNSAATLAGVSGSDMVDLAFSHSVQSMYLIKFDIRDIDIDQDLSIVINDTGTTLRRVWITTERTENDKYIR